MGSKGWQRQPHPLLHQRPTPLTEHSVSQQLCGTALLPAACACQEASSVQRSSSAYLGVYSSPGPAALILTCTGRITILTGAELAPTRHLFTPTGLPLGFAGRCEGQREGVFLRARQVMCTMCSPPAKICCLKRGLSILLHLNSECENPACPSVP